MTTENFIHFAKHHSGYWGEYRGGGAKTLKYDWLHTGSRLLKKLAKELRLPQGSFKVSINPAGIAVSGEATLHGEWIYVDLGQSMTSLGFMWRFCEGRKDYTGKANQWARWEELKDLPKLAAKIRQMKPVELAACH